MRFGRRRRRQPAGVTSSPTRSTMGRLSQPQPIHLRRASVAECSHCRGRAGVTSSPTRSTMGRLSCPFRFALISVGSLEPATSGRCSASFASLTREWSTEAILLLVSQAAFKIETLTGEYRSQKLTHLSGSLSAMPCTTPYPSHNSSSN
jgi:hypothetical protein